MFNLNLSIDTNILKTCKQHLFDKQPFTQAINSTTQLNITLFGTQNNLQLYHEYKANKKEHFFVDRRYRSSK